MHDASTLAQLLISSCTHQGMLSDLSTDKSPACMRPGDACKLLNESSCRYCVARLRHIKPSLSEWLVVSSSMRCDAVSSRERRTIFIISVIVSWLRWLTLLYPPGIRLFAIICHSTKPSNRFASVL